MDVRSAFSSAMAAPTHEARLQSLSALLSDLSSQPIESAVDHLRVFIDLHIRSYISIPFMAVC